MKQLFLFGLLLMFSLPLFSEEKKEKEVKTFDFESADIVGASKKPAGSNVDTLKGREMKTKIRPREDFLPELSSSVDEI